MANETGNNHQRDKVVAIVCLCLFLVGVAFIIFSSFGDGRSIKFNIPMGLGLLMIGASLITAFAFFDDSKRKTLIFAISVTGGLAAAYSAIPLGQMVKQNINDEKKSRSFALIADFDTLETMKIRTFITDYLITEEVPDSKLYSAIVANPELCNATKVLLNHIELISLRIQEGNVDEVLLYKIFGMSIPFYYDYLEPFITGIRDEHKNDDNANKIFSEFEKLAEAWRSGKLLSTGKPLSEL